MTGTAKTEEREFRDIYGLDVIAIPANQGIARNDKGDIVYKSENAKFEAVAHEKGPPVLVGTRSIDKSERLATILRDLIFPIRERIAVADLEKLDREAMKAKLCDISIAAYEQKEAELTPEIMRVIESQYTMLPIIDRLWVDHLYVMDALKPGIGLRGYGQKDPRVEYEKEANDVFEDLKKKPLSNSEWVFQARYIA